MPENNKGFSKLIGDIYSQSGIDYAPTKEDIQSISNQYKGDYKSFLSDFYKQSGVKHELSDDDFTNISKQYKLNGYEAAEIMAPETKDEGFLEEQGSRFIKASKRGWRGMVGSIYSGIEAVADKLSKKATGGIYFDEDGKPVAPWDENYAPKDTTPEISKNVKRWAKDVPEPQPGVAGFIGELIPQTAMYATAIMLRNPALATTAAGTVGVMSLGSGTEAYDRHMGEIGEQPNAGDRMGVGVAYALAEYIPERIGLGKLMPKGATSKVMKKFLGENIENTAKVGKEIIEEFAKKQPGKAKKLLAAGLKAPSIEAAQEIATEIGQIAADEFLIGEDVTRKEMAQRITMAGAGGAAMGGMLAPFSTFSQRNVDKSRREKQGFVSIAQDETGAVWELTRDAGGNTVAFSPSGKTNKDLGEEIWEDAINLSTDSFNNLTEEARKAGNLSDEFFREEEHNTISARVQRNLNVYGNSADGNLHLWYDQEDISEETGQPKEYYVIEEDNTGMSILMDRDGNKKVKSTEDITGSKEIYTYEQLYTDAINRFDQENPLEDVKIPEAPDTITIDGKEYTITGTSPEGVWTVVEMDENGTPIGEVQQLTPEEQESIQSELATDPESKPEVRIVNVGKTPYKLVPTEDGNYTVDNIVSEQEANKAAKDILSVLGEKLDVVVFKEDSDDAFTPDTYSVKVSEKVEAPILEPSYTFQGESIPKEEAEDLIAEAEAMEDLAGLTFENDPETQALLDEKFAVPEPVYKVGDKVITRSQAKAKIRLGKTEGLVVEGDEELQTLLQPKKEDEVAKIVKKDSKEEIKLTILPSDIPETEPIDKIKPAKSEQKEKLEDEIKEKPLPKEAKPDEELAEQVETTERPVAERKDVEEKVERPVIGKGLEEDVVSEEKQLKQAEKEVDTTPTEAQKEAGNYKKGHAKFGGFSITIENPKGSTRSGVDESGKKWSQKMANSYGYFKRTLGKDGDQVDLFVGPNNRAQKVYVVDQINPDGTFDEHKILLGMNSEESAREAYLANYEEGWTGLGAITEMNKPAFKKWLNVSGKNKRPKRKPVSELVDIKKKKPAKFTPEEVAKRKERKARAVIFEPETMEQAIMQYFLKGNRLKSDDIQDELIGKTRDGKLRSMGEWRSRLWMAKNDAPSIDQLLTKGLVVSGTQFEEKAKEANVFRNALIEVLRENPTMNDMVESINEYIDQKGIEEDPTKMLEDIGKALEEQERAEQQEIDAIYDEEYSYLAENDLFPSIETLNELFIQDETTDKEGIQKPDEAVGKREIREDRPERIRDRERVEPQPPTEEINPNQPQIDKANEELKALKSRLKKKQKEIDERHGLFGDKAIGIEELFGEQAFDISGAAKIVEGLQAEITRKEKDIEDLIKSGETALREAKGQDEIRFKAEPFYSPTEKALSKIKQTKGTPEQFKSMLLKNGAKQTELNWMRFDENFVGKKSITKEDIQEWIDQNKVEVEEITKGDYSPELQKLYSELEAKNNGKEFDDWNEADQDKWMEERGEPAETKYQEYQLPGGENYKEVLLTMPGEAVKIEKLTELPEGYSFIKSADKWGVVRDEQTHARTIDGLHYDTQEEAKTKALELLNYQAQAEEDEKTRLSQFKSTHFDEPNILAHIRFNERTDSEGNKVLFIEEIQSDWAQEGRKKGFDTLSEARRQKLDFRRQELEKIGGEYRNREEEVPVEMKQEWVDIMNELQPEKRTTLIPDMPFKKTDQWINLGLRRMIRYAAENGFDKIAWTTGEQQADRYDLSKQIDSVSAAKLNSGKYSIQITKDGNLVDDKTMSSDELPDYIGKELAQKIVNNKEVDSGFVTNFSGIDLKVGGEGMKSFYDKIVPKMAGKLGKKFGAKVEVIELPEVGQTLSLPITSQMYETAIGEGFPLFKTAKDFEDPIDYTRYLVDQLQKNYEETKRIVDNFGKNLTANVEVVRTKQELPENIKDQMRKAKVGKVFGVYDSKTDTVYLVAEDLAGNRRLTEETILHEIVGHKGLRGLLGNEFNTVLNLVYSGMSKADQIKYFDRYGSERVAADEYLADMAEMDKKPTLWNKVISKIREVLRKLFPNLSMRNSDVITLLDKSKKRLEKGEADIDSANIRFKADIKQVANDITNNGSDFSTWRNLLDEIKDSDKNNYLIKFDENGSFTDNEEEFDDYEYDGISDRNIAIENNDKAYAKFDNNIKELANLLDAEYSNPYGDSWYIKSKDDAKTISFRDHEVKQSTMQYHVEIYPIDYSNGISKSEITNAIDWFNDRRLIRADKIAKDLGYIAKEDVRLKARTEGQPDQTKTKAFKDWFNDSKVVDEKGEALIVYNGTPYDFSEFLESEKGKRTDHSKEDVGFHFSNDPEMANTYAQTSEVELAESYSKLFGELPPTFDLDIAPSIMPVYLSIQNPFIQKDSFVIDREIIHKAKEKGHDGIMAIVGNRIEYVSFEPTQIKSATANLGAFDPQNPDIRFKSEQAKEGKKQVTSVGDRIREMLQDNKLALKNWQNDRIVEGIKIRDFENAYQKENLYHGKVLDKMEKFTGKEGKQLIDAVGKFAKAANLKVKDVQHYLVAKHGPERNRYFWSLDDKNRGKDFSGLEELQKQVVAAETNPVDQMLMGAMPFNEFGEYYSQQVERKAGKNNTDNLWKAVNKATDYTLKEWKDAGFISKEQHEELKSRYGNYVPLRGWEQTDEFDYSNQVGQYSSPIKRAKGRSSLADDPLSYIMNMANTAVVSGERNRIKQAMGNLVRNNREKISPYVQFKPTYFVRTDDIDAEGNVIIYETIDRPDQKLFDEGRVSTNVPTAYKERKSPAQAKEYEVEFYENGQKLVLTFEGSDPAVARAVDGKEAVASIDMLNKSISNSIARGTRFISSVLTSRNPSFILPNMMRDIPLAIISEYVHGNTKDATTFFNNMRLAEGAIRRDLRGKPDVNNPTDIKYQQFLKNGGATGFVHLKSVDTFKKELLRDIKTVNNEKNAARLMGKGFRKGIDYIEQLSEWSENISRFAVYLNHINKGESPETAAFAAKNSTVNFNKKGRLSPTLNGLFAFFNAAIQASDKYFKMWGANWKKMAGVHSVLMVQGFMSAYLMDLFGDEDEEGFRQYDKVSDYVKSNYLVLPIPYSDRIVTIPMPHVLRAFHGMGVKAYDLLTNRTTPVAAITDMISGIPQDIMPIDGSGFLNRKGDVSIKPFTPTVLKPLIELQMNENFMGMPITPIPYTAAQADMIADTKLARKNVNSMAKKFTDKLYELGGGDETGYRYVYEDGELKQVPAMLDLSPHSIEHLFGSYLGGTGSFFNNLYKTTENVLRSGDKMLEGEEFKEAIKEIDLNSIPVFRRFVRQAWGDPLKSAFYDAKRDYERKITVMRDHQNNITDPGRLEKFLEMQKEIGVELGQYKAYEGIIDKLNDTHQQLLSSGQEEAAKEMDKTRRDLMQKIINLDKK